MFSCLRFRNCSSMSSKFPSYYTPVNGEYLSAAQVKAAGYTRFGNPKKYVSSSDENTQCLNPRRGFNKIYSVYSSNFEKNYAKWKENPREFERINPRYIDFACRKCPRCLKRRGSDLRIRAYYEFGAHRVLKPRGTRRGKRNLFITLTFDEPSHKLFGLPYRSLPERSVAARPIRLWLERVRALTGESIKHMLVYEHGGEERWYRSKTTGRWRKSTSRNHIHGILWGCTLTDEELASTWSYGNVTALSPTHGKEIKNNAAVVNYMLKYMTKGSFDEDGQVQVSYVFISPGVGKRFLDSHTFNNMVKNGCPILTIEIGPYRYPLPKYYAKKIFPEDYLKTYFADNPPGEYRLGDLITTDFDQWYGYAFSIWSDYFVDRINNPLKYMSKSSLHIDPLLDSDSQDLFVSEFLNTVNSDSEWLYLTRFWSENQSILTSISDKKSEQQWHQDSFILS